MFDQMETGAPVPLGFDDCGDINQSSIDICGFGMKDMGDSYGFGANVKDFINASLCNKEKVSSMMGPERIGNGQDKVVLIVYLDSDGNQNGGCSHVLGQNSRQEPDRHLRRFNVHL